MPIIVKLIGLNEKRYEWMNRGFLPIWAGVRGSSSKPFLLHTDKMSYRGGRGGGRGGRGGFNGGRRDFDEGPPERVVGWFFVSNTDLQRWDT